MTSNNASDTLLVQEEEQGARLDQYLSSKFNTWSRSYFQNLIGEGLILVNGEVQKKRYRVQEGDEIEVEFALTPELSLEPEPIPLDILYEDEALLAINKPAGLVVHPAPGHPKGTFVNALLYHCHALPNADTLRPGIVHRLDKQTSGVLLAAKTQKCHEELVHAFAARKVKKEYLAICIGNPKNRIITTPIGRHKIRRKEMTILEQGGKPAETKIETVRQEGMLSVVRLFPKTGRTHQLRVHLKSVGAPILGDEVYGNRPLNEKFKAKRQLLHAATLSFTHPITSKPLEIKAPLPDDFALLYQRIVK